MFSRFLRLPIYAVLLVTVFIAGCDSNGADGDSPTPIAPEAFLLETDLFSQDTTASKVAGPNFTAAAFRVWPVSLIVSANLLVPAAITQQALDTTPYLEDGVWKWFAITSVGEQEYSFSLEGTPSTSSTSWSMKINTTDPSSQEPLSSFELFTGTTSNEGRSGSWNLYYPLNDSTTQNVLNANFELNADSLSAITFSIPASAATNAGDAVTYQKDGTMRSFRWSQSSQALEHVIEWDNDSRAGSIMATNYNAGVRSCWDANLDDVPCLTTP